MYLSELIDWLENQQDTNVLNGFGYPHSYRGDYSKLAFIPISEASVKDMLQYARSALNEEFQGYKGGIFFMKEDTECYIAEDGCLGEPITSYTLKYWELTKS